MLKRVIPFAHSLLEQQVCEGDIVIDATIGNGHDTLLLANLVGPQGKVYGFDIQDKALEKTNDLLQSNNMADRVVLFQKSHDQLLTSIPEDYHGHISCGIFNLGYLPGSDKSITTVAKSTIAAIEQLLGILIKNGIIILVVYHGHEEGKLERDELLKYLQQTDQKKVDVVKYEFINQKNNPPFLLIVEKKS